MTSAPLTPVDLTCNGNEDPLGIDLESGLPRLGWRLQGDGRGRRQTAYQVEVAQSDIALSGGDTLWHSGRVESDRTQWVPYGGPRPRSRQRFAWRVRAWDEAGRVGPWSVPARWEMGLLAVRDWRARRIAPVLPPELGETHEPPAIPAPLLRTTFAIPALVRHARLYVCGLGLHEVWINGSRVGNEVLDPPFTRYDVRALYATHDVTALVRTGANAIGVMLGHGWFDDGAHNPWWFAPVDRHARPAYGDVLIHVAQTGLDSNPGTAAAPLRTIQRAADVAQPGEVITVHEGIYRERIDPPRGGASDERRIVFQAARPALLGALVADRALDRTQVGQIWWNSADRP